MGYIRIDIQGVANVGNSINSSKSIVSGVKNNFNHLRYQIDKNILARSNLTSRCDNVYKRLLNVENNIEDLKKVTQNAAVSYDSTERFVINEARDFRNTINGSIPHQNQSSNNNITNTNPEDENEFYDLLWDIIGAAGAGGTITKTFGEFLLGKKDTKDVIVFLKGIVKSAGKSAETIEAYLKENKFDFKKFFGFSKSNLIDKSLFRNVSEILKGNFESRWSNFGEIFDTSLDNELLDYSFKSAKTVGEKVKVACKWAGDFLSLGINAYENFTDTEENNSTGRKVAETIGETVVDIGTDILIGAGITAGATLLGVTYAPAIVTAGLAVGANWCIDSVCECITGKDFSETVSDAVLDITEGVGTAVGSAVKSVSKNISTWWSKNISFGF